MLCAGTRGLDAFELREELSYRSDLHETYRKQAGRGLAARESRIGSEGPFRSMCR